jgi:hypothetical protein
MYGSSRAKQIALPRRVQSSNAPIGRLFVVCETPNFEIARIVYAAWLYTRASRFDCECVTCIRGWTVAGTNHSHLPFADSTIIDWDAFPELNEADFAERPAAVLEEMFAHRVEQKKRCVL